MILDRRDVRSWAPVLAVATVLGLGLGVLGPQPASAAPIPCRADETRTKPSTPPLTWHYRVCDDTAVITAPTASGPSGLGPSVTFAQAQIQTSDDGGATWTSAPFTTTSQRLAATATPAAGYRLIRLWRSGEPEAPSAGLSYVVLSNSAPIPDRAGPATSSTYVEPEPEPTVDPEPEPTEDPEPEPEPTTPVDPEPEPTTPPTTEPAPDPEPTTPAPQPTDPPTTAAPDPTTPAPEPTTPAAEPDPEPEPTTPTGDVVTVRLSDEDRGLIGYLGGGIILLLSAQTTRALIKR